MLSHSTSAQITLDNKNSGKPTKTFETGENSCANFSPGNAQSSTNYSSYKSGPQTQRPLHLNSA